MIVLALDLGTRCGWAVGGGDRPIVSGVFDLRPKRFEGGGMRSIRMRGHLNTLLPQVELVAFEEVRWHLGVDAAHCYGALMGEVTAACEMAGKPYLGVPVATIKRHATGKGNADKTAMVTAARARGWHPADDNEADALWLLDYAVREFPDSSRLGLIRTGIAAYDTSGHGGAR